MSSWFVFYHLLACDSDIEPKRDLLALSFVMACKSLLKLISPLADVVAFYMLFARGGSTERFEWLTTSIDGCVGSSSLPSSVGSSKGDIVALVPVVFYSRACCSFVLPRSRFIWRDCLA